MSISENIDGVQENCHEDHNHELMEKTSPVDKTKLLTDKQSLEILLKELAKAGENIHATILEVENQQIVSINNLRTKFKELHNILEQREQELVEDAMIIGQQKLQKLSEQEKTLFLVRAEVQNVVDYTERRENSSFFTSINTELSTIQHKIQEYSKSRKSLEEPVEEADMVVEVRCAEVLQELCLTQANITPAVDPAKCTVDLTAPAEVGKTYVETLTTRLSNGKPNYRKCKVTCHIKSLYNGVTTNCVIDSNGPGRYSIQYTSTVRGRHELTVLINGHHVAGSPFPVYVYPTQLGKPIKIWTGITRPNGITANSKGEILVALEEKRSTIIIKFNAEGKRVHLVEKSGLVHPCCIACDDEDNIYCVDEISNKVLTCDGNGGKLKIHEVELDEESAGRSALAITDKKLFMAERYIYDIIKVYNKQLQHLLTIKHRNMDVADISFDSNRNLYVSDNNNSCVHVFTKDGAYIHSIGHDMEKLMKPRGLSVRGPYVYVTEVTSHCVLVFTTDGKYVTSFGQQGQKEGDFNYPYYIYVDNNSFIYVCDFRNDRIQCV